MTPEGKNKAAVKALLKKYGVYWHMPIQQGLGAPSLDFICCCGGRYLAIETKAPGKRPTPRQYLTMAHIQAARGVVFVIDGTELPLKNLEEFLRVNCPKPTGSRS